MMPDFDKNLREWFQTHDEFEYGDAVPGTENTYPMYPVLRKMEEEGMVEIVDHPTKARVKIARLIRGR